MQDVYGTERANIQKGDGDVARAIAEEWNAPPPAYDHAEFKLTEGVTCTVSSFRGDSTHEVYEDRRITVTIRVPVDQRRDAFGKISIPEQTLVVRVERKASAESAVGKLREKWYKVERSRVEMFGKLHLATLERKAQVTSVEALLDGTGIPVSLDLAVGETATWFPNRNGGEWGHEWDRHGNELYVRVDVDDNKQIKVRHAPMALMHDILALVQRYAVEHPTPKPATPEAE